MYELTSFKVIQVLGADAEKVINNLCTNDLKKLDVGKSCEAFVTNVRGWCVEHGFVFKLDGAVLLVGQFGNSAALCAHIDRYIVREDAKITDLGESTSVFLLSEEETRRLVDFSGVPALSPKNDSIQDTEFASLKVVTASVKLLRDNDVLVIADKHDHPALLKAIATAGISLETSEDFQRSRIASFWPQSGREILEKSIPQELDRDHSAISFTKGCYLGQETIARLDAIGQLQKKLCLVRIDTHEPVEAGAELMKGDQPVGHVTSAMLDATKSYVLALAYLRRGNFEPGLQLKCSSADAVVLSKPS